MDFMGFISIPIVILIVLSFLIVKFLTIKVQDNRRKKMYHPISGTIFNQLINFSRLHDYMTNFTWKHGSYKLLSSFKNKIYIVDPANVEYILKKNFDNYGKVWGGFQNFSTSVEFHGLCF